MFEKRWKDVWRRAEAEPHLPLLAQSEMFDWVKGRVTYRRDTGDHWQTPQETLQRGAGDCEDFAILWLALAQRRDPDRPMRMVIGSVPEEGHHAVAVVAGLIYDVRFRISPTPVDNLHQIMTPLWSLHLDGRQVAHLPMKRRT